MADTDSLGRPEVEIFRRFADAGPLEILPESIEKRPPPEPDIRCATRHSEILAFEMVEVIDQELARVANQLELGQELRAAYQGLPERDASEIRSALGNGAVIVSFADGASIRARRAAMRAVLEALKAVPPSFEGALDVSEGVVDRIYVARGNFVGPCFDIDAGGAVGEPTIARVRGKLEKRYGGDVPLELLAHYELHPMFPDDVWIPRLRTFVSETLPRSPFRRVWVFDAARSIIRFVHPAGNL